MILSVNAKNAAAMLPGAAGLQQVVAAEKSVSVKKFYNVYAAFDHVAREYQKQNYRPGGPDLYFPSQEEMEINPWFRDRYHDNVPASGDRFFVVTSGEAGHIGIFNRLDFLASVFIDAPVGTEAVEVPDLSAAVARVQTYVAENIMSFSAYVPAEQFRMVHALPLNEMVKLPYLAWMQAHCVLPQGLRGYSRFGYAQPPLAPVGKTGLLPADGRIECVNQKGGENHD